MKMGHREREVVSYHRYVDGLKRTAIGCIFLAQLPPCEVFGTGSGCYESSDGMLNRWYIDSGECMQVLRSNTFLE